MPNDGSVIGMAASETLGYIMRAADAGMTPADFTTIATTAGFQMGIVSQSSKGWKTFADVVAAAKDGQKIRFGAMSSKLADLAYLLGKGVAAGDLVNLASALSVPLKQTPEAPTLADLGVEYNADGHFIFFGPAGMPTEVRDAIAAAIGEVVTTEGMKSHGMIQKAFGGTEVITGDALQAKAVADYEAAGKLLAAAQ